MNKADQTTILLSLIEQATNSATEGITISAMRGEDRPLIYINEGFERLTGYTRAEALGKNCRFLQGENTDEKAVDEIRQAIRQGKRCTTELLNYKKDGTPFWNRLSITPLRNEKNELTHYVGVQSDITELRETRERLELANSRLELFHTKIMGELEQAGKAQQFILPEVFPKSEKIRFGARYEPMDQIGGDFYDIIEFKNGVYGILIADVTGHGIPAALLTFMISSAFKSAALKLSSTADVIAETNKQLYLKMPMGAFITMFYALYDTNTATLRYTQAGHPPGLIIRAAGNEVLPLQTNDGLVGVFDADEMHFREGQIKLQAGDKLILYTDAIIETSKNDRMLGMDQFTNFLISNHDCPIADLLDKIYQFGIDYSGRSSYDDDLTLVGFDVLL